MRAQAPVASLDSDLEAFSHNPTHGSFAPLAFQPSAMTNCGGACCLCSGCGGGGGGPLRSPGGAYGRERDQKLIPPRRVAKLSPPALMLGAMAVPPR